MKELLERPVDPRLEFHLTPPRRICAQRLRKRRPLGVVHEPVEVGLELGVALRFLPIGHSSRQEAPSPGGLVSAASAASGVNRLRSALLLRCTWLIAVPSGMPSNAAISA